MKIQIVPSGKLFGCGEDECEQLEIRIGSIIAGKILRSRVLCNNKIVSGNSLPEMIQNVTGCSIEEAVDALRKYSEECDD